MRDAAAIRDLLAGLSDENVRGRVFAAYDSVALFGLDSSTEAPPLNHPVYFEVSNRYVDVARAEAHLHEHPMVKHVAYERGRPSNYDHVPSSLQLVVALPDAVRATIEHDVRAEYARYIRGGERCAAGPSNFERAFTWSLSDPGRCYGDPLGLRAFARARDEYQEPDYGD